MTTKMRDTTEAMKSIQDAYFDQCVDFIVRMIEKYGDKIPQTEEQKTA